MKLSQLRLKIQEKEAAKRSRGMSKVDRDDEELYQKWLYGTGPRQSGGPACTYNPMADATPPEREDSYTEDDDEADQEQSWKEALSLLARAKEFLLIQTKFMDARNLTLPGDADWEVTKLIPEIAQFVSFYEKELAAIEVSAVDIEEEVDEEKPETLSEDPQSEPKMIVMGPVRKVMPIPGIVSHQCRHTRHNKCVLVQCDCPCHDDEKGTIEVIREHVSHETDVMGQ